MPRATIDYMNARRECKPASGGKRYLVTRNAFDDKAQWQQTDTWEQALLQCDRIRAEFNSWSAASRIDIESLKRGETLDDLSF